MSRADMGRTNRPRTVNDTNSHRPRFVWPRAKYRSSLEECVVSTRNAIGTLRKTSSISQSVTRCVGQFFPMLPSSQSHPSHWDGSNLVMPSCISQTYTIRQPAHHLHGGPAAKTRQRSTAPSGTAAGLREPIWELASTHRPFSLPVSRPPLQDRIAAVRIVNFVCRKTPSYFSAPRTLAEWAAPWSG